MRFVFSLFLAVFAFFAVIAVTVWGVLGRGWNVRQPELDPLVARLFRIRDIAGLLVVAAAYLNWQWGAIDAGGVIDGRVDGQAETFGLLLIGVFLVLTGFVVVTRRGMRGEALALCAIPVFVMATVALLLALIFWVMGGEEPMLLAGLEAFSSMTDEIGSGAWWTVVLVAVLRIALIGASFCIVIVLLATFGAMLWMVPGGMFRANDVHPMLGPILMIGLSGWTLVGGLTRLIAGAEPLFPVWVTWALSVGGPLTVIALTLWQIIRLVRAGYGIRTVVHRAADDPVSSAVHRSGRWVRGLFIRA